MLQKIWISLLTRRGYLNILLLHTNKATGHKKSFFVTNKSYKSKNQADTIKAVNEVVIEQLKIKPQQVVDSVFDGGLKDTCGGKITFSDGKSSKTVQIVHDFCHIFELSHKDCLEKAKDSTNNEESEKYEKVLNRNSSFRIFMKATISYLNRPVLDDFLFDLICAGHDRIMKNSKWFASLNFRFLV